MTKENILKKLKELKPQYEKEGLSIVGLFGSFAKGKNDIFNSFPCSAWECILKL